MDHVIILEKADIKRPGSRGGRWYRDPKRGDIKYGEMPKQVSAEEVNEINKKIKEGEWFITARFKKALPESAVGSLIDRDAPIRWIFGRIPNTSPVGAIVTVKYRKPYELSSGGMAPERWLLIFNSRSAIEMSTEAAKEYLETDRNTTYGKPEVQKGARYTFDSLDWNMNR